MIQRDSRGQIASRADVFAMHRRQMKRANQERRERLRPTWERAARRAWHTRRGCDTGGRLNGWPICWFCYVETRLDPVPA